MTETSNTVYDMTPVRFEVIGSNGDVVSSGMTQRVAFEQMVLELALEGYEVREVVE